jgi:hypothetical protein
MKNTKYLNITLLAPELISIQPLSAPSGTLHYMEIKYIFCRVLNYDRDEFRAYEKELEEYLYENDKNDDN